MARKVDAFSCHEGSRRREEHFFINRHFPFLLLCLFPLNYDQLSLIYTLFC
jgi:hypothetical protein